MSDGKTGRGGKRTGSGRKATGKATCSVTFLCPISTHEKIGKIALERGVTKSRFVRMIVERYLSTL